MRLTPADRRHPHSGLTPAEPLRFAPVEALVAGMLAAVELVHAAEPALGWICHHRVPAIVPILQAAACRPDARLNLLPLLLDAFERDAPRSAELVQLHLLVGGDPEGRRRYDLGSLLGSIWATVWLDDLEDAKVWIDALPEDEILCSLLGDRAEAGVAVVLCAALRRRPAVAPLDIEVLITACVGALMALPARV